MERKQYEEAKVRKKCFIIVQAVVTMRSDVVRCGSEGWGVAQRGAVWLRGVRCGSEGCGVAQRGAVWLRGVRCGSDCCASACCTAGPISNLGSAPQRRPSTERMYNKSGSLRVLCKDKMPKIWNKFSQKRNIGVSVPISTFMCLWANYIFPQWVCLFCWRKYVDWSWEYINRSKTHECGNWGWGRAIPRKGIHKRNCRCSVVYIVRSACKLRARRTEYKSVFFHTT